MMEGLIVLVICAFIIGIYIYRNGKNKWIAEQEPNGGYFLTLIKDEEEIHYSDYFENRDQVIKFVEETKQLYEINFIDKK